MDFPSPEQFLRDGFNEKTKIPERGFKRVDTIDNDSPSGAGKKRAVLKPCSRHSSSLLSRPSRKDTVAFGMFCSIREGRTALRSSR